MNTRAEFAIHIEKSLIIYHCQVDDLDYPDIGKINHISKDILLLWPEIIRRGSQPIEVDTDIDMDYDYYESNSLGHINSLIRILKQIIGKTKMSEEYLTKVEFSRFGNNPQTSILCDIIQDRLFFNHLQRVVIKKVLNHAILNKKNQYYLRNDIFLFYVGRNGRVGKSRIVKAIYLGFCFLKRQKELLIAVLTEVTTVNINTATIHEVLNIDNCIQK